MKATKLIGAGVLVAVAAGIAVAAALGAFNSGSSSAARSHVNAIGIHGQWHIEIRDHGRLVKTLNFHNDTSDGAELLPYILDRTKSVGGWGIGLYGLCGGICEIDEGALDSTAQSHNLTLDAPVNFGILTLKGSIVNTQDGTLNQVTGFVSLCDASTISDDICRSTVPPIGTGVVFSNRTGLSQAIVAGQQVLVTVTYTFSNVS